MKGIDIVVKGSVGHMSAFMAQAGTLVVLGDAGEALGDSIYEARLYRARHGARASAPTASRRRCATSTRPTLRAAARGGRASAARSMSSEFRRYGSARQLYHFHIDNVGAY